MTERRARTPQPTESGWYYARHRSRITKPEPALVYAPVGFPLSIKIGSIPWPLDDFDFFGPVPMIEAQEE